ncbi:Coenzyme F420-dependent N5 N10-methylene tetrahydromethanopterin reductase-like protein [Streptomyces albus]|uniref:Coenzyme F420-dependent N5 N10-methylene tetrahydromethanopterin reductase-like protein n=1 Tax=Streptomyces albus (strain ATCC 21838 / DSM 41398 / FERM P-419 / JCM 4703 / NBRC 107858) TaxID=1081613 RepID=A0A0B5EES8_STRA4|nr:Coenzyme F420-dependent N5 N10-methylene tetrahydromethanopterin reductase-like protein [Streptomyces albus]AOU74768.1 Coenzyme F420-dependent N5 N10-methylene tetrahydromethanopterin reductase-like protein [Streptomyces albus]AYN30579.1 LLM class F420-dependent oxidoreductase [Streptomyces albus]
MEPTLSSVGAVGLWVPGMDLRSPAASAEAAAEVEELGYGALWLSEGIVRDPFMEVSTLLGATRSLIVGTGIAVIWGRHPRVVRGMARALLDAHPGRFVLGLGTSHARMVEGVMGLRYERPLAALREHLDRLDEPDPVLELAGVGDRPAPQAPRVLAALGPRALALARERSAGAFSYLVTPEHTAGARAVLGPDRTLIVEQAVVTGVSVDEARARSREHIAGYLPGVPYRSSWRRLGFDDADFADGGSDRLVDALVASGEDEIAKRVGAHLAAGADHVCLQALSSDPAALPLDQWRSLAHLTRRTGRPVA